MENRRKECFSKESPKSISLLSISELKMAEFCIFRHEKSALKSAILFVHAAVETRHEKLALAGNEQYQPGRLSGLTAGGGSLCSGCCRPPQRRKIVFLAGRRMVEACKVTLGRREICGGVQGALVFCEFEFDVFSNNHRRSEAVVPLHIAPELFG